jgi:hypothetical protein
LSHFVEKKDPMLKKYIYTLVFLSLSVAAKAQQNVTYFNFLDYTSKWKSGAYFSNAGGAGRWKEILYIKGDTSIANQWYYKVYNQYQLYDNDKNLKKLTDTYAYALREDKDSIFHFIYPNGNKFSLNHSTTHLDQSFPYKQAYKTAQIPFTAYYDNQMYGAACSTMQGIGNTSCPPNTNGVLYFECYNKGTKSTNVVGEPCSIELLTINSVKETRTGSMEVYPNPMNDKLYIKVDETAFSNTVATILFYDSQGILKLKSSFSSNKTIDTSELSAGIYLVNIITKEERFFYKIVK